MTPDPNRAALSDKIERLRANHFAGMETMRDFALSIIDDLIADPDPDIEAAIRADERERYATVVSGVDCALKCLGEIAASHIPDCPAAYAYDELAWAQRHVAHLRRKAEICRDGIAAAIRAGGE